MQGTHLIVCYLGNFGPPSSTESHVALSLEALGHTVIRIQEGETPATSIAKIVDDNRADVFLHTQTRGLAISGGTDAEREQMYRRLHSLNIPTVGFHLDLFFGLDREDYVRDDPYFRNMDFFFSTDGGHDDRWAELGINHIWMPPGVVHTEAYDGTPRREFTSDVAFVGSWRSYAHDEHWATRRAMLFALRKRYGRRFQCWPKQHAIRGTDLTDLYASVKVVVGDSCLAGKVPMYVSDRVTETMGRGGLLIHPHVEGLDDVFPFLVTYPAGDWAELIRLVDLFLANDAEREGFRNLQAEHTRENHTYKRRMEQVLEVVCGHR